MTNTLVKGRETGTATNTLVEGEGVAHQLAPGKRMDLSNADGTATLDAKAKTGWKVYSRLLSGRAMARERRSYIDYSGTARVIKYPGLARP